ncbi:MAG: hydroxyacid dehydrogenase, partial [Bacteroidia bacterium]|nr:hydroxyacid dehydrogenase [Bacteroidia bacterium]
ANAVSFHVPLTEETFHMGNRDFFNSLEQKPYFLNTSRGKVVNIEQLVMALKENKIAGAGIDVMENENLDSYNSLERENLEWLSTRPNVIITPHIAGYSQEAFFKMAKVLVDKILK